MASSPPIAAASAAPIPAADSLARYRAAVIAIRVACISFVAAIAGAAVDAHRWRLAATALALIVVHAVRIISPLRDRGRTPDLVAMLAELALHTAALVATGGWDSPLLLPLLGMVAIIGFARGLRVVIPVAVLVAAVVDVLTALQLWGLTTPFGPSRQWSLEVVLVGSVAGYARRITTDATRRQHVVLQQVQQLSDANELLASLHRVAQTLPAALDLESVLDATSAQIRENLAHDGSVILLADDVSGDGRWKVGRHEGVELAQTFDAHVLPAPLQQAIESGRVVRADFPDGSGGLRASAQMGIYAPLMARDRVVGLAAVEFDRCDDICARRAVKLLEGLQELAGLGIDNARWFARLRLVGAEEERARIAHDLHDGVGQTLAYLGFELDRLKSRAADSATRDDLSRLRGELRTALSEIRETLFDLRSDVSDAVDAAAAFDRCCSRVRERSGLQVSFRASGQGRLPQRQERELWRIGQEIIVAAERQWNASTIAVHWWRDGHDADITVVHDGTSVASGRRRGDGLALMSLRDRCDCLGASLSIEHTAAGQTALVCRFRPVDRAEPLTPAGGGGSGGQR